MWLVLNAKPNHKKFFWKSQYFCQKNISHKSKKICNFGWGHEKNFHMGYFFPDPKNATLEYDMHITLLYNNIWKNFEKSENCILENSSNDRDENGENYSKFKDCNFSGK